MPTSEEIQKRLQTINQGKAASFVADQTGDLIDEMKKTKLALLIQHYRNGKTDIETYISGVASICALDDLQKDLHRRIVRGRSEEHKERENEL